MYTVELDWATHTHHDDPLKDAQACISELGVDLTVVLVTAHGPAGGNPVMVFQGEFTPMVKLFAHYYEGAPDEFKDAVVALLKQS